MVMSQQQATVAALQGRLEAGLAEIAQDVRSSMADCASLARLVGVEEEMAAWVARRNSGAFKWSSSMVPQKKLALYGDGLLESKLYAQKMRIARALLAEITLLPLAMELLVSTAVVTTKDHAVQKKLRALTETEHDAAAAEAVLTKGDHDRKYLDGTKIKKQFIHLIITFYQQKIW